MFYVQFVVKIFSAETEIGDRGLQSQWREALMGRDKIVVRGALSKFWLIEDGVGTLIHKICLYFKIDL